MKRSFPALILLFMAVFAGGPAGALAQECRIVPSSFATLSPPAKTAATLWSMDGGDRNLIDRFVGAAVDAGDRHLVVLGERYYDEGENVGLTLRKLDGRGRTVWDTILNNKAFEKVIKIMPVEKGFMVLAGRGGSKMRGAAWIGFFDGNGALTGESEIREASGGLTPYDILPLNNARSFVLSGQATGGTDASYPVFYRLDRKAKVTRRKAYQMGLESAVLALGLGKGGMIYGMGYIYDGKGRRNGWAVKLDEGDGLVWQRQLARGRAASLTKVMPYDDNSVIVTGYSRPYDLKTPATRNTGAWVALLEADSGDVIWERFYSEPDHDLIARDVTLTPDGQITVLMDASVTKDSPGDVESFTRLVSFNKRGVMLDSAAYLNGAGAQGYGLVGGAGNERYIVGATRALYTAMTKDPARPRAEPRQKKAFARQGWAIAVPSVTPYEDPCEEE